MSARKNVIYYIKKNIFIVLVLISLCPVLALSYAKFTINSESYRSNEMYISELLYSIKIDNENTYTIDIDPGETEHTIEITSLSGISTNYKLAYLNNDNLEVKYASDYMDASFGGIIMTRTISLTIKNTSTEKQTLSLMVFGGYSFNDVEEVKVLDTYTEIDTNYLHYDYETTALYVDNTRVDELDINKYYDLKSYTCSNDTTVEYDTLNKKIIIGSNKQTKCSLYFEESKSLVAHLISNYQTLGLAKIDQEATGNQSYIATEYRYQGATPNNYITFNDEVGKWKIVGVFEVQTPNGDGTYTKEYKAKLVRDRIGNASYNYRGSTNAENKNDWANSALMIMLNSGPYYNKAKGYTNLACSKGASTTVSSTAICDYSNDGLTEKAKSQLSSTKWYLGNVDYNKNTKEIYAQERSTNVHSGNSQTWDGKVALIYTSDYMYASSGCYNDDTKKALDNSGIDYRSEICKSTNWLLDTNNFYYFLSPSSYYSYMVMRTDTTGYAGVTGTGDIGAGIRQSVYLDPKVLYLRGDGTSANPFTIE